jgi:hypothetical protein
MIAWLIGTSTGRNLLAIGAGIVAVLAVIGGLMRAGAQRERSKTLKRDIKAHEVRNEVDRDVARSGDPKRRLRSKWMRGVEAVDP